jgi:hypothetical protein
MGCIAIRKGKYMILNKEYEKEEYYELKNKIDEQLKKEGTYGQYFPAWVAPFSYNEALAQDFFPLGKDEALKRGFSWQEKITGTYGKETIKKDETPNTINDIDENILKEIFVCSDCGKNYRLIQAELDFYKRMHLPIPHKDFECRHKDRMSKRNPRKLWSRSCMCKNINHIDHKGKECAEKFKTTYSPERQETIYCEKCYQQEVA